ncbi:MAG: hypothetical protein NC241_05115 [Bacteroides sp.]|nr:hypothetical protein [Bacteroides sp.]MCM1457393.1 hypothetical protein [Lachnoclostridium sp.]
MNHLINLLCAGASLLLVSCGTSGNLSVPRVIYQSIRTEYAQPAVIPENAQIAITYLFNERGEMQPIVNNLTGDVMIIDQTKSFVIMPDGSSISYYDPTVISEATGNFNSQTDSETINLGAITDALGVNGRIGSLARGVNIGSSTTNGTFYSKTVTRTDQPMVTIGPKGMIAMSKAFRVAGVGINAHDNNYVDIPFSKASNRFSCCIYYSADEGATYQKLVTNFYVSSNISKNTADGRIGRAFTSIYKEKPDALVENLFMFLIPNNISTNESESSWDNSLIQHSNIYDNYLKGILIDFQ